ncbi:MAG TPA: hypothetical protein DF296_02635 [Candidatus Margulisbacteria bacterium]|nr:hypothetical protein [Candidatus Margulisiibacteriota bacterium]
MKLDNRKKMFIYSNIASYMSLVVTMMSGLISVKVALGYLGPTVYGIWLTINSIVVLFQLADLGIPLSTMNYVAQADCISKKKQIVRKSLILVTLLGLLALAAVYSFNFLFPPWAFILGDVPQELKMDAGQALLLTVTLFLVKLPFTVFSFVFSGFQKIYWTKIYGALTALGALFALCFSRFIGGNLIDLAMISGIISLLIGLMSGMHLLIFFTKAELSESGQSFALTTDKFPYRNFLSNGIRFLCLQLGAMIVLNTDNIIISQYLGPGPVPIYAVAFKVFYMAITFIGIVANVLWPMYSKAVGNKNWPWIQQVYSLNLLTSVLFGGAIWVGGVLFYKDLIELWLGSDMYGGLLLVFSLGGYVYMATIAGCNTSLLNALNPTNTQVFIYLLDPILNLLLSITLIKYFGISGVALGTLLSIIIVHSVLPIKYIHHRSEGNLNVEYKQVLLQFLMHLLPFLVISVLINLFFDTGFTRFFLSIAIFGLYLIMSIKYIPKEIKDYAKKIRLWGMSLYE